jgi:molecular chaperone HtpG
MVSNAVDATQKLKTLAEKGEFSGELGDLTVRVSLDTEKGTITISARGIGMTEEEIDKYINQIAFSGVTDFLEKYKDNANNIIGHFGLGFYSSFMVSNKVEIITKSYRDGAKAVKWSCDGSPAYEIDDAERDSRGSDIILHIDDEDSTVTDLACIRGFLDRLDRPLHVLVTNDDGDQCALDNTCVIHDTSVDSSLSRLSDATDIIVREPFDIRRQQGVFYLLKLCFSDNCFNLFHDDYVLIT